ncbi:hypothetical protein COU79_05475 [Candidatus Peregrinibacteria bacterium CG10_big_fil_rev_8_21_14_0_10_54_7]|nr:MAG: hypothetical protein COU79_05475 [Candidatus Peregrinibacteria bacterium CG10_big_fil_rev_8_21_14_0_10_54_7]
MANKWLNRLASSWEGLKTSEKWTTSIAVLALIISGFALLSDHSSSASLIEIERAANDLDAVLVRNSEREIEVAQKKLSFDIINTLYRDFYQFGDYNTEVIRKLKGKQHIEDAFNLELYLNGFEDLYEQCKTGLISRAQIRIHFEYLIGTTCNNAQVERVVGDGYNGLKLLCHSFWPNSRLALKAKQENASCK